MKWLTTLMDKIRGRESEPAPAPDDPRLDLLKKHEERRDSGEDDADRYTTKP